MSTKIICMTPVRNEAWCLDVFLKCTSFWADHIIIADQNSTDGSVDIARKYSKVILIENQSGAYNEQERQGLLIDRARMINGNNILIALDADEIFSSNYAETEDWQKILNSKPGDVFSFQWAHLKKDEVNCWLSENYFPWAFHDDGKEQHGNYARKIHSMRIPYPIDEKQIHYVNNFKVLHLPFLNPKRQESKNRYYQCIERLINQRDPVSLFRQYNTPAIKQIYHIDKKWIDGYLHQGINIYKDLDLNGKSLWFDDEIMFFFEKHGIELFKDICIFESNWIKNYNLKDPRSIIDKCLHLYLTSTRNSSSCMVIKIIDKLFKYFTGKSNHQSS